eukprot:323926_1
MIQKRMTKINIKEILFEYGDKVKFTSTSSSICGEAKVYKIQTPHILSKLVIMINDTQSVQYQVSLFLKSSKYDNVWMELCDSVKNIRSNSKKEVILTGKSSISLWKFQKWHLDLLGVQVWERYASKDAGLQIISLHGVACESETM